MAFGSCPRLRPYRHVQHTSQVLLLAPVSICRHRSQKYSLRAPQKTRISQLYVVHSDQTPHGDYMKYMKLKRSV